MQTAIARSRGDQSLDACTNQRIDLTSIGTLMIDDNFDPRWLGSVRHGLQTGRDMTMTRRITFAGPAHPALLDMATWAVRT